MASVNKAILTGYLGQDPEAKYMPNGKAVTKFTLATSENWKDKATGEKKEQTQWHRCVAFGPTADFIAKYAKKGTLAYAEVAIKYGKFQDKNGVQRDTVEITLSDFKILKGGREKDETPVAFESHPTRGPVKVKEDDVAGAVLDDAIPF